MDWSENLNIFEPHKTFPLIFNGKIDGVSGEDLSPRFTNPLGKWLLVGGWATPLKNMKVNWDDYKPNINGKIKNGNKTTNQKRSIFDLDTGGFIPRNSLCWTKTPPRWIVPQICGLNRGRYPSCFSFWLFHSVAIAGKKWWIICLLNTSCCKWFLGVHFWFDFGMWGWKIETLRHPPWLWYPSLTRKHHRILRITGSSDSQTLRYPLLLSPVFQH